MHQISMNHYVNFNVDILVHILRHESTNAFNLKECIDAVTHFKSIDVCAFSPKYPCLYYILPSSMRLSFTTTLVPHILFIYNTMFLYINTLVFLHFNTLVLMLYYIFSIVLYLNDTNMHRCV